MTDFVIAPREYPRILELLVERAPDFASSPELVSVALEDRELPSVICGAFGGYLQRLYVCGEGARPVAAAARAAVERLASSPDPHGVNALVVDVFEQLDLSDLLRDSLIEQFGPASRRLFDRWVSR